MMPAHMRLSKDDRGLTRRPLAGEPPRVASDATVLALETQELIDWIGRCRFPFFASCFSPSAQLDSGYLSIEEGAKASS